MNRLASIPTRLRTLPVRPVRGSRPRTLLAVLAIKDEMRYLPGWFTTNAPHVDGVVVYDDGSTDGSAEYAAAQPQTLTVIHRDPTRPPGWDETVTRRAVHAAAGEFDADWLIALDADERLEEEFGARARRVIPGLERRGISAAAIRLVDLWDEPDRMRVDGAWAHRQRARLFRWRADAVYDDRPLHGHWAPLDARVLGGFVPVDLVVYHLAMIDRADRRRRRARHRRLDPQRTAQAAGYDHLVDESGLRTQPLPAGRAYAPLHRDPPIAVVVTSVGCPPTLRAAVRSLLAQSPTPEICVVNSGGGNARAEIGPLGVRVIDVPERVLPGAARNLGVTHTRAGVVAFLADDCIASPGCVARRIAHHGAGASAVACAVVNAQAGSAIADAAHVLSFGRRLPGVPSRQAARYGVSYDRTLLERVGPFRTDLRVGEDTELNARLDTTIAWAPDVQVAHHNPTTARALIRDQYHRGRNTTQARATLFGRGRTDVLRQARGVPSDLVVAWNATPKRRQVLTAIPWIAVGLVARFVGATGLAFAARRDGTRA